MSIVPYYNNALSTIFETVECHLKLKCSIASSSDCLNSNHISIKTGLLVPTLSLDAM